MKSLAKAFANFSKLFERLENMDPKTERFSLTERNVHGALPVYKQIYDEKKKQTEQTIRNVFLKRVTPPQEEPQTGPSRGIPEEANYKS